MTTHPTKFGFFRGRQLNFVESGTVMRESYGLQTSNSVVNIFAKFASKFEANFIFKMERMRNAVRIAFFQNNGANLAVRFYMKKSEFQRIFQYFQFKLC